MPDPPSQTAQQDFSRRVAQARTKLKAIKKSAATCLKTAGSESSEPQGIIDCAEDHLGILNALGSRYNENAVFTLGNTRLATRTLQAQLNLFKNRPGT